MWQLFKIEWLKIKTYRTFWILFLSFVVFFPVGFFFTAYKYMEKLGASASMQEQVLKSMLGSPFVFPRVWHASAWMGGIFFVILGMLFILLITNEVQYRTHRQNIIDGWSRMDFLKAKFSLLIFFVLVSTVLVLGMGLLVGLMYSGDKPDVLNGLQFVGYFLLMATLYLMLAFLVAILVKRTGLSIIIYFTIVCMLDNILWVIFTLKDSQVGYFMPLEAADSLITNPFKPAALERRTVADWTLIAAAIVYISVYAGVIIRYFRNTDLKT